MQLSLRMALSLLTQLMDNSQQPLRLRGKAPSPTSNAAALGFQKREQTRPLKRILDLVPL